MKKKVVPFTPFPAFPTHWENLKKLSKAGT